MKSMKFSEVDVRVLESLKDGPKGYSELLKELSDLIDKKVYILAHSLGKLYRYGIIEKIGTKKKRKYKINEKYKKFVDLLIQVYYRFSLQDVEAGA